MQEQHFMGLFKNLSQIIYKRYKEFYKSRKRGKKEPRRSP